MRREIPPLWLTSMESEAMRERADIFRSSWAGLTRASITLRKNFFQAMDCRIKSGNDES
jgi:hypothetical protein